MTAGKLLEVLPGDSVFDPFMGGGCTIIEGMRAGRTTFGSDISPLAVFLSNYHTWLPTPEQKQLFEDSVQAVVQGFPQEEVRSSVFGVRMKFGLN